MPEIFENGGMHEYQEAFDKAKAREEEISASNSLLETWLRESMIDFAIEYHAIKEAHPGTVYRGLEISDDGRRVYDVYDIPYTIKE